MIWRSVGHPDFFTGGKPVLIRSLLLATELGDVHRYRVCSEAGKPVWARLAKDSEGKIGVLVTGPYSEVLKIPSRREVQPYLFVPLNSLSKKMQKKLLIPLNCELYEEEIFSWIKRCRASLIMWRAEIHLYFIIMDAKELGKYFFRTVSALIPGMRLCMRGIVPIRFVSLKESI